MSVQYDTLTEEVMDTFLESRIRDVKREIRIQKANEDSIRVLSSLYVPKFTNNIPLLQEEVLDVDHISPVFRRRNDTNTNSLIPLYIEAVDILMSSVDENNNPAVSILYGTIIDYENEILLKVPDNEEERKRLTTEYAIGFYAINRLRDEIPNFMQTYGIFECGKPVRYKSANTMGICDPSENQVNYMVIENIKNSVTSAVFVQDKRFHVVCSLLLQVYLSLLVARERVKFSHYDLHSENVLVREMKNVTEITYRFGGNEYVIRSHFIATIIDFGRSMVTIDGNVISGSDIMPELIGPYPEPKIEIDMYRYFMSCVSEAPEKERYQGIYELFGGKGPIVTALDKQLKHFFLYPDRELDIDRIIQYLQNNSGVYDVNFVVRWTPENHWDKEVYHARTVSEYFESLPEGKDSEEIDEDLILRLSEKDLVNRYKEISKMKDPIEKYYESRKYVALARLHISFVDNRGIESEPFTEYLRKVISASDNLDSENIRKGPYGRRKLSINIG